MEQPIFYDSTDPTHDEQMKLVIYKSLLELGIRPMLKGFRYLNEAIFLYYKLAPVNSIVAEVYTKIAEAHDVPVMSIDRCIRKAIEDTWYGESLNKEHCLFECTSIKWRLPPTNSCFVATMSEVLRYRLE